MEITVRQFSMLLQLGESETLEYKESFGDEAIETLGAFANARGGVIILGVRDSGDVTGLQLGRNTLEEMANKIQNITDPRLQPSVTTLSYDGKTVIILQVSAKSGSPVSVRGRYFRRVGKTNQRMSHEEIMQAMTASMGLSWDACVESLSSMEDLQQDLIDRFIADVRRLGRRPIPEQIGQEEFLKKMGLVQDNLPTRAALLLFGKNPEKYFPSAFLKIGRFRSPTHITDDLEAHGSLIEQLDRTMGWFRDRLSTEFSFTGKAQREVLWEYPLNAIREAIINVLCHRDYTSAAHSQIRLYDERLEIWNSGTLPPPLTPEMLLIEHDSIPRNRKLAEAFFYMGLIERWGSGTTRIALELATAGLPPPHFVSHLGKFQVIFRKKDKKQALSDAQEIVVQYVREKGSISNALYQKITGVSKRTASRELKQLVDKGVLTVEGSAKKGRAVLYRLVSIKGP
ncbi:MAG: transcriptional regulator [Chlamydiae bacterium]|nr:transcriptional regulator [Chlamydiota bacterium]